MSELTQKEEMEGLIRNYYDWLKNKTSLSSVNDEWVQITTPFLDRHNDYLQIYAKKENHGFLLTDDGYIIHDLLNSGCDLKSHKRQELLRIISKGFGVEVHDNQLTIHTFASDFGLKKHNLIQAMLAINDLFYLSSSHVKYLFYGETDEK